MERPIAARRVLVLSPFPPCRDGVHGGARTIAHLLGRLVDRHEIALLYLRSAAEPPVDELLASRLAYVEEIRYASGDTSGLNRIRVLLGDYLGLARGVPSWVRGLRSAELARRAREVAAAWAPDVVQLEYPAMGQYVAALSKSRAARVLVEHDVAVEAAAELRQRSRGWARLRAAAELVAWRRFERALLARVDAVVVFTHRDAAAVRDLDAGARVTVVPLGAEVPARPVDSPAGTPPGLLFVGSFVHEPNVDAAVRLARDIFPRVRGEFPDLTLDLVGHAPPAEVRALAASRVAVHADVPDVRPYLERASVVVAPLRLGGGMRVKVLEALAAGKAVVASPRALEGIAAAPGEHLLVAESDDEFATAVAALVRDPARRASLGEAAHGWARENLSWDRSATLLERLYDSLIRAGQRGARTT